MDYPTPHPAYHNRPWESPTSMDAQWNSPVDTWHSSLLGDSHLNDGLSMQRYHRELEYTASLPWTCQQTAGTQALHKAPSAWQRQYEVDSNLDPDLRYSSPAYFSGPSSMYTSDSMSDRQSPPARSPHLTILPFSPEPAHREHLLFDSGVFTSENGYNLHGGSSCVAMENVQRYADAQPEKAAFEDEQCFDFQQPQEGFIPMQPDLDDNVPRPDEKPVIKINHASGHHHRHSTSPVIRRRRAPSHRVTTYTQSSSRVNKRGSSRRSIDRNNKAAVRACSNDAATPGRAFPCPFAPYGCSSAFMAKNEWKRHVYTQHLRLGYWRCDQCGTEKSKRPNDFNRKDLFVQHVRRMHPIAEKPVVTLTKRGRTAKPTKNDSIEEELNKAADRCHQSLRSPPIDSCCFFCDQEFHGSGSFEERLEHIGKHMEGAKKEGRNVVDLAKWNTDDDTEQWLLENGIVIPVGKTLTLAEGSD